MDVTVLTTLISTVGFPIAACIALFWRMNKQDIIHKEEMDSISEALNNNTIALLKLSEKIGDKNDS